MFSSSFFSPDFFGEFFKVVGTPIIIPKPPGKGNTLTGGVGGGLHIDLSEMRNKGFAKEDEDVLEFIIAFVLNRSN